MEQAAQTAANKLKSLIQKKSTNAVKSDSEVSTEKADASAEISQLTETNIIAWNKAHGWIKKKKGLTQFEVQMWQAWLSWGIMASQFHFLPDFLKNQDLVEDITGRC